MSRHMEPARRPGNQPINHSCNHLLNNQPYKALSGSMVVVALITKLVLIILATILISLLVLLTNRGKGFLLTVLSTKVEVVVNLVEAYKFLQFCVYSP